MGVRRTTFWPLPGSHSMWIKTLKELLVRVRDEHHSLETLAKWIASRYGEGLDWTKNSLRIALLYTGLVEEKSDGSLRLSNFGAKFVESNDPEVILDSLLNNIWGIREIMFWLKEGRNDAKQLFDLCVEYGALWKKRYQVIYRLKWLIALGAVERVGHHYTLTPLGLKKVEEMQSRGLRPEPLVKPAGIVDRSVGPRMETENLPSHAELQETLLELGRLEGYEVGKEYSIDSERIDVAWWRKVRKRPDIVFEIQRAGNFYAALTKLKEAWDLWECRVVLVTSSEYLQDAKRWLKRAFHEMENYSSIVLWNEVVEWLKASRIRDQMRKKLGLP